MDLSQLPDDSASIHSDHEPESQEYHDHQSGTPAAPLSDNDEEEPSHLQLVHRGNTRSPHWMPWQDRYLAQAVDQVRPFLLPLAEREEGWNRTAEVLLQDSRAVGERSTIDRSGSACKNRFMRMMKDHKVRYGALQLHSHLTCFQKGETESRMKTGAVEEVSAHIKASL
jgi:hypothetical protein